MPAGLRQVVGGGEQTLRDLCHCSRSPSVSSRNAAAHVLVMSLARAVPKISQKSSMTRGGAAVPQCCRNRINVQMAAGASVASMRVLVAAMRMLGHEIKRRVLSLSCWARQTETWVSLPQNSLERNHLQALPSQHESISPRREPRARTKGASTARRARATTTLYFTPVAESLLRTRAFLVELELGVLKARRVVVQIRQLPHAAVRPPQRAANSARTEAAIERGRSSACKAAPRGRRGSRSPSAPNTKLLGRTPGRFQSSVHLGPHALDRSPAA